MTKSKCIFVAVQFSLILGIGCAVIGYVGYLYPPYEKAPSEAVEPQSSLGKLLDAIEWVESGGDANAVGDGGRAVGAYQIHPIYVDDVNRIMGHHHFYNFDRLNKILSREMVRLYLTHYGNGRSLEYMARIHNGGPTGWKKESTKPYWEKVKARLEQ